MCTPLLGYVIEQSTFREKVIMHSGFDSEVVSAVAQKQSQLCSFHWWLFQYPALFARMCTSKISKWSDSYRRLKATPVLLTERDSNRIFTSPLTTGQPSKPIATKSLSASKNNWNKTEVMKACFQLPTLEVHTMQQLHVQLGYCSWQYPLIWSDSLMNKANKRARES